MGLLDTVKTGLLNPIQELFSGRVGGQTLYEGIRNRLQPNSLRPALSQQQMIDAGLNIAGMAPMGIIKNKKIHDAALDYFGKTTNPKETGYILDDGTRLDLSGRHMATGYEKTGPAQYRPKAGQPDYLANSRNIDHRQLVDLSDKVGEDLDMYKFIDQTGAVRYMPDYGVSVLDTNMPSRAQVETFVRDFRRAGDPLSVDVDSFKTGGNVASQEFARPTVDEVYDFIQKYQKGDGLLKQNTLLGY